MPPLCEVSDEIDFEALGSRTGRGHIQGEEGSGWNVSDDKSGLARRS